ncbi:PREDICTED: podocalyxin [Condylura cristata]|uniref:podocalyxin n=1 Tax=Condylura cristata TaxID=143302 RepID=UPI0003344850|nr:PREDICTED: podocalyxin [Condylura cristata]
MEDAHGQIGVTTAIRGVTHHRGFQRRGLCGESRAPPGALCRPHLTQTSASQNCERINVRDSLLWQPQQAASSRRAQGTELVWALPEPSAEWGALHTGGTASQPTTQPVTTAKATDPTTSHTSPAASTETQKPTTVSASSGPTSAAPTLVASSPSTAPGGLAVVGTPPPRHTTGVPGSPDSGSTLGNTQPPQASTLATRPPTTAPPQPVTTSPEGSKTTAGAGAQSGLSASTAAVPGTLEPTTQPTSPPGTGLASAPSTTPGSPALQTLAPTTPSPPGSLPGQPGETTAASGSSGTPDPTATSGGEASTPLPSVTSSDNPQTTSKMQTVPGTSTSITWTPSTETPQPTGPSLGPVATGTGPTGSTTLLPSTAPPDSSPSPTPTFGYHRIKCEPPEQRNEKMLVLNLTNTGLCAGSSSDDKLVMLLCRAAKATFNPAQDQCHVRLAPILSSQEMAIKEITIETKLLPQDVYELLKPKWDDLKEVGVSNMQLGGQGPPEETEDRFSMPLIITIVCMASFLLLVAALYGCCHQRLSQRKDQQRLTEELQTVENGYHDNPTLEVMETSSEMQEKKVVNLNGELGDSWIVPLDNLIKDDLDEEEDTHL